MNPSRARGLLSILILASFPLLGALCSGPPARVVIDLPINGAFTTAASVAVTGHITRINPAHADVKVNGAPVAVQPDSTWSTNVALADLVNPIVAEMTLSNGKVLRDRVTVIQGESIADGDFSPMSIALRLNDLGLDEVEPVITSLVDLDLATLLPPGTLVIQGFCYIELFGLCVARTDIRVNPYGGGVGAGAPAPSIASFSLDVDSMVGFAAGDIVLNNLFISTHATAVNCNINVSAATTTILGDYALSGGVDGSLDVTQLGGVAVLFGGFSDSNQCGGVFGGFLEFLIDLLVGNVQNLVQDAITDFLNTPDAVGNTPIAGAIEGALAGIEIAGPIGESIGVSLEAPIFDVFEDDVGLVLDSDARITASMPDPGAVDLLESYHVPEPFPDYAVCQGGPTPGAACSSSAGCGGGTCVATTPLGQDYGLAISIATSAFNQLLKAEIESGLLRTTISELDLGTGPTPLTAGFLSGLVPELSLLNPDLPMEIQLQPMLAPMVTGADGPEGEIAEMRVPHLRAALVETSRNTVIVEFVVDAVVGLEIGFVAGELSFNLGSLDDELGITITKNTLATNEVRLEVLLQTLLPFVLPTLADSLGSFPLPEFLGLELGLVEVGKSGAFMSLFLDLTPVP